MKEAEVSEIIACLPRGKTRFHYFKDRYAFQLLAYAAGGGASVRALRASPFGRLLQKPAVNSLLASAGNRPLTSDDFESVWPAVPECYLLTLGMWGDDHVRGARRSYSQLSRNGANLVLQLNFSNKHNAPYRRLVENAAEHPFIWHSHPIGRNGYFTLAWARIDLDLDRGEALIEEIQNDWLRNASWELRRMERIAKVAERSPYARKRLDEYPWRLHALQRYVAAVLAPHYQMWDEAMLSAAIWFLREELGISRVYQHGFESGCRLKRISTGRRPPRSVYTSLPKKFCLARTCEPPGFLRASRKRQLNRMERKADLDFWVFPDPS